MSHRERQAWVVYIVEPKVNSPLRGQVWNKFHISTLMKSKAVTRAAFPDPPSREVYTVGMETLIFRD